MNTKLQEMLGIEFPVILAHMFLASNVEMIIAATAAGITGCMPAHNFRTIEELRAGLEKMKNEAKGPIGINLIVHQSNVQYKEQLKACLDYEIDYFITSLGKPDEVIQKAHEKNIKVFCDVIDHDYAKKVIDMGCDALIAVNNGAGGHLGKIPASVLVPMLKKNFKTPVISAGGVNTGSGILSILALGADGLSIGSPFIATKECLVSKEYKQACIDYGAADIAVTTKLSGTPCTVIKTPYVKKIGTEQNFLESYLNKNKQLKKYAKMLTFYKGMNLLEKAAFSATYKNVWCAGSSIEFTKKEETIAEVVRRLKVECEAAQNILNEKLS